MLEPSSAASGTYATASLRRRSASPPWSARPSVWRGAGRQPTSRLKTFGGQRGQISFEFESAQQELTGRLPRSWPRRARSSVKSARRERSQAPARPMRSESATLPGQARLAGGDHQGARLLTESVRKLLRNPDTLTAAMHAGGRACRLHRSRRQYEGVVDEFLRDELNYLVVKSWDAANAALQLLRTTWRAAPLSWCIPMIRRPSSALSSTRRCARICARIASFPLKDCIRVLGELRQLAGGDPAEAGQRLHCARRRDRARAGLGKSRTRFTSRSRGECFHNVMVTGGKQLNEGPLSDEARIARRAAAD